MKNLTIGWTPSLTIFYWTWSLTSSKTQAKLVRSGLQFSCALLLLLFKHQLHRWVGRVLVVQNQKTKWLIKFSQFCVMKCFIISASLSSPERHQCAIWIKKLCDPATCSPALLGRKNRNMYARLLLHMLKRGLLELPFTVKPGPGPLKTLPTYMVRLSWNTGTNYFAEIT